MISANGQPSILGAYVEKHYAHSDLLGNNAELQQQLEIFFNSLQQLGNDEILSRSQDITRFLKENGVTYNIYGDPSGMNRAWNLDLIPFLISKEEWLNGLER